MLDDLKKDRHLGFGAQERLRLSLYVAGLLVLGGVIFIGTRGGGTPQEDEPAAVAPEDVPKKAEPSPMLDPAEVRGRVDAEAAAPGRWADRALEYVLDISRRGRMGDVSRRVDPEAFAQVSEAERGQVFELVGRVSEVAGEAWSPRADSTGNERLWTVVLEGADAIPALAVKYGNRSDVAEGAPVDEKPPGMHGARIEVGQHVVARGVYIQRRTGSFGGTAVLEPAPVLLATSFRIVMPPDQMTPVISSLDEALWGDVRDRSNRDSRKWDEDALFEVIQWARAQGYDKLRAALASGELPWSAWERQRFDTWKEEVDVEEDDPRPITDGARGRLFRFSGLVAEVLDFGWATVPRNRFNVDRFQKLTLLSDHYRNVALELFLPYPLTDFPGVTGAREQHLRLYGVFIKNFTYDTQFPHEDGSGRRHPATVPMFVVLHAEPYPEEEAGAMMRSAMLWVAGAMVLFALLFYVVLIRGGARQTQRMEEHRLALRKRIRAKGQGAELPRTRSEIPPEDGG